MIRVPALDIRFVSKYRRKFLKMKSRKSTISKALSLRLEVLENRELLSAAPWSAPVEFLDAQVANIASAQVGQEDVIDLSNAQLENSVSFVNTGIADHQFALSWAPIDGASTYSVKINRDGSWIQYNKGLTETSCVMNGLYAGKTYDIRVCAMNENGRFTGDYLQTSFAPVRIVGSVNKFVEGDDLSVRIVGSADASVDIAWYYATPEGDVEITEARGLLSYVPKNPQYDVKVVATGIGLSEGSASEASFVYSGAFTVNTNYDPESQTLQVEAPEVEGAVKYYIWKPAPSGNMAIYQRTTEPVFTVSNLKPGQTTNFRVSAYDANGKVLDSKDFQFASAAIQAPEIYEGGQSFEVAVAADASLQYDLSWYYVTETGDVEIADAKGLTSFTPDAATYPIKIVATPISESEGLCVAAPVEAIVNPYVAPQFGINDPYVTTKRSFVTTWDLVSDATRYAVQKLNANGQWVKMTAFDFVDGQIVGDTRATLSEDGTQFSYSVNMVKIGVEERYRVLAIDAKGVVVESGEFTYNPVGLTVQNDAYDLANGSQTLRAATVQGVDDSLQYQWYYSTNADPTNWQVVDGATSADLVLSADEAALNYNYKVLATDPNEDRQSVAYARADTLDAPTILTQTVDPDTGNLLLTWSADASLSADNFIVQYYRTDGEYSAWSDLPQGTITANGDGTFSLTHVNGANYKYLRVRAVNETGWSEWHMTIPGGLVVDTKMDAINPNDGYTSWREAINAYQALAAEGAIPPGIAVTFDPKVFDKSSSKISLKVDQPTVVITENVRIDASNLGYRLQIQAPNSKRNVFKVIGENASLELVSLNIFGANHAIDGAIIHAEDGATVKVVDCTFASNRTSQHGGVIALSNGSTLIVENCLFQNNIAQLGGGAVYAVDGSSVTVKDSTFTNNTAGGNGNGGAIWLDASSPLEIENSTFTPDGEKAIWVDDSVVSAALLDAALIDLEDEITLF